MGRIARRAVAALIVLGTVAPAFAGEPSADEPAAPPEQGAPPPDSGPARTPRPGADDPRATRLARLAHAQAAAIDALPRFSYRVRYRHGIVDSMRAVDVSVDLLKQALTAPVLEKDWLGWYQTDFSWDETRFLWEMRPGDTVLNYEARFWTPWPRRRPPAFPPGPENWAKDVPIMRRFGRPGPSPGGRHYS